MIEIRHHWMGHSCCEFTVDLPLDPTLFRRLGMAAKRIRDQSIADGAVSSYRSLGVYWSRELPQRDATVRRVTETVQECFDADADDLSQAAELHRIAVRYDGPDLADVAMHCELPAEEIVRRHSAAQYVVAAVGFMPNFAYLWGLDSAIATPRKSSPRFSVPAGAVGIAGDQTGVYPQASPGGWQLIGTVDADLCRRLCPKLKIGDVVQFEDASS